MNRTLTALIAATALLAGCDDNPAPGAECPPPNIAIDIDSPTRGGLRTVDVNGDGWICVTPAQYPLMPAASPTYPTIGS